MVEVYLPFYIKHKKYKDVQIDAMCSCSSRHFDVSRARLMCLGGERLKGMRAFG